MMLSEICTEIRNYFCSENDIHSGEFVISDGILSPCDFLLEGQYFRIVGSVFNDGVWQYPATGMKDEQFTGSVWAMRVPPALVALSEEIKAYSESDMAKASPYMSESFGEYSYTKAANGNGSPDNSWQRVFASRLNKWRKIHV